MQKKIGAICVILAGAMALSISMSGCANMEAFVLYTKVQKQQEKINSLEVECLRDLTVVYDAETYHRTDTAVIDTLYLSGGTQEKESGVIEDNNGTYVYTAYMKDDINYVIMNGSKFSHATGSRNEEDAQAAIEKELGSAALRACSLTGLENGMQCITADLDLDAIGSRMNVLAGNFIDIYDLDASRMTFTRYNIELIVDGDCYLDSYSTYIAADVHLNSGGTATFILRETMNVNARNSFQSIHYPADLETAYPRSF